MKRLVFMLCMSFLFSCGSNGEVRDYETIDTGSDSSKIYKTALKFGKEKSWIYDPAYYRITYPGGDVPSGGACTDVIIRVLREHGMDLQKMIHEDMSRSFSSYPSKWGLTSPDPNIDHRRVPNMMRYFERKGYSLPVSNDLKDYQPGDIIAWELSPGVLHIGIALKRGDIYHNIGPSSAIDRNFLFSRKIIGHYRIN